MDRQFSDFKAAELFCPRCNECLPVREHKLACAREDITELRCARCGTVVGRHVVTEHGFSRRLACAWDWLLGRRRGEKNDALE